LVLHGRDLLGIEDLSRDEISQILDVATAFKTDRERSVFARSLDGKSLAMIFARVSTRTRVSFEVAMTHLGGHGLYLRPDEMQWHRGEEIRDTSRVLSRYVEGIVIRIAEHELIVQLAEYASIPVINAMTLREHPCQALADLLTIREKKGRLAGIKLAYAAAPYSVGNSLMFAAGKLGMDMRLAIPREFPPDEKIVNAAKDEASKTGGRILVTENISEAVQGADVVYSLGWGPAEIWTDAKYEKEREKRNKLFGSMRITSELLEKSDKHVLFMHCLPAFREREVADAVIEGPHSVVFDEAENRLHVQKAILTMLL